jgi:FkbM family methyltransferase
MYEDLLIKRPFNVDGIEELLWIKEDNGAWDGPKRDWEDSHIHKIKRFIKNWDTVVQAGGCCGMYPALLGKMFKSVYTFEPDPLSFHCLVNNCQKDHIIKMNCALGDSNGLVDLNRNDKTNVGTHSIQGFGKIPMIKLDDLNLKSCDFIMLDVEGYESFILEGAIRTISNFRPVIQVENANQRIDKILEKFEYNRRDTSAADTFYTI